MADKPAGQNPRSTKQFDAILVPTQYPRGLTGPARDIARKREFAALLGSKYVHSQMVPGNKSLLAGEPTHQFHASDHPHAGEDRFEWVDRGDGVLYGLLTPEAAVTEDDRARMHAARTDAALDKGRAALEARHAELEAVPAAERTDEEKAELAKCQRFLAALNPSGPVKGPTAPPAAGSVPKAARDATGPEAVNPVQQERLENQPAVSGPGSRPPLADRDKPGVAPGTQSS